MAFDIHFIYRQLFKIWRQKRFHLFIRCVNPSASDRLLDVGGYPDIWIAQDVVKRVVTLNVHPVAWDQSTPGHGHIAPLVGDGCAIAAPDGSFEIGYSNSVIEHVGSWQRQQQFAAEIRRVGKALWVQTPAYECPIEPHYLAPFIHYLPRPVQKKMVRWCTIRGWLERPTIAEIDEMVETTRLLRRSEFAQLFPDCTILTERLLGFIPKSYIAFRQKSP